MAYVKCIGNGLFEAFNTSLICFLIYFFKPCAVRLNQTLTYLYGNFTANLTFMHTIWFHQFMNKTEQIKSLNVAFCNGFLFVDRNGSSVMLQKKIAFVSLSKSNDLSKLF